jgi:hypothetical protein
VNEAFPVTSGTVALSASATREMPECSAIISSVNPSRTDYRALVRLD